MVSTHDQPCSTCIRMHLAGSGVERTGIENGFSSSGQRVGVVAIYHTKGDRPCGICLRNMGLQLAWSLGHSTHRQYSSSDYFELWVQQGRAGNALGTMPVLHHGPFPVFLSSAPYPWEPEYVSRCHFEK